MTFSNDTETSHGAAIEVRGLSKRFGWSHALRDVDLTIPSGGCLALYGPNGAGKSTLIGILSTLVRPTTGTVSVAGYDVGLDGADVRRHLGVISHSPWVYDRLTVRDNLEFFARLYGVTDAQERIDRILEEVELARWGDQEAGTLSRGMRQRLTIARALLPDPKVLLLDEPFTGLDRHSSRLFSERLARLREGGRTILLVTHHLDEGWALADSAAILVAGRIRHTESVTPDGMSAFASVFDDLLDGNNR
jgi:heme exporter protein A